MSETSKEYFRFQKVEDYFQTVSVWDSVQRVAKCRWDAEKKTLVLYLKTSASECGDCDMLVQIMTGSVLCMKFHPKKKEADYSDYNSRAVIRDTVSELRELITADEFEVEFDDSDGRYAEVRFRGTLANVKTIVGVTYDPFRIEILRNAMDTDGLYHVFETSAEGIRFRSAGGLDDYHIVQSVAKALTAKYVGFGEQGGLNLIKNNQQITYFNYDNMRYSQVYNCGPLEEREPLYHSDPFFMEVNGVPGLDGACGLFHRQPFGNGS